MSEPNFDQLLQFFKVLGNESRLKILGLLANQEWSVNELAEFLDLKEPTVSHHLSTMKALGLVTVRADGNSRIYQLNTKSLESMSKDVFSKPNLAKLVDNASEDGWEAKVRRTFIKDGRLTNIPSRRKKQYVIMQWVADHFEWGTDYPEKTMNERLKKLHPDHASLRRYLIDHKLMEREGGIYWRINTNPGTF